MAIIPQDIKDKFLNVIRKELALNDFENWVYQSKQLEEVLPNDIYLELISFDYKANNSWESIFSIYKEYIAENISKDAPFTEWAESIFNLPKLEYPGDVEYFAIQIEDREQSLRHMIQLLKNPGKVLKDFSADQIGQGLTFLFDGMYQKNHVFLDSGLDWNLQQKGILSIEILFQEIFAKFSEPSHPEYANSKELDYICHMWWDLFPTWGAPANEFLLTHHDDEILNLMERILYFKSLVCVDSAIHGLNHWVANYRERVHLIINKFLDNRDKLPTISQGKARCNRMGTRHKN